MAKYLFIPSDYHRDVEVRDSVDDPPGDMIPNWTVAKFDNDCDVVFDALGLPDHPLNERATNWLHNYTDAAIENHRLGAREIFGEVELRGDVILSGINFQDDVDEYLTDFFVNRPAQLASQVQSLLDTHRLGTKALRATREELAAGQSIWETKDGKMMIGVSYANSEHGGRMYFETPEMRSSILLSTKSPEGNLAEASLVYSAVTQLTHPEAFVQAEDVGAVHREIMKEFDAAEIDEVSQRMAKLIDRLEERKVEDEDGDYGH